MRFQFQELIGIVDGVYFETDAEREAEKAARYPRLCGLSLSALRCKSLPLSGRNNSFLALLWSPRLAVLHFREILFIDHIGRAKLFGRQ